MSVNVGSKHTSERSSVWDGAFKKHVTVVAFVHFALFMYDVHIPALLLFK